MEFKPEFVTDRDKQLVTDLHVCERLQALVFELETFADEAIEIFKRDRTDGTRCVLAGINVNLQYEAARWARACK